MTGCFTAQQTTKSKETFTFDYTPKQSAKLGSANMVLAFIKPYYATSFESSSGELFKRFQAALGSDVEELIIAKGFTLKGPYQSLDEMVFDDKKATEILIEMEIVPEFTAHEGGWRSTFTLMTANRMYYSYSGQVSLVGKINISGVEPLTHEKIWSKSVLIPNVDNIPIKTSGKYDHVLNNVELINDPGVYNELGKALMTQYAGIMDKIAAHFEVEELSSLKNQIKELKAKKGF